MQPGWLPPRHLEPLAKLLRRIIAGEAVRVVVHTPPRHGKTETLLHFIVWGLLQRPDWTFGYASYAENIAYAKADEALQLAQAQGDKLQLKKTSLGEWRLRNGRGGMLTRGIGGGLTGMGINVGIVDDPVKDRLQAESSTYRERTWGWFTDVFFTRIEPGGSVIVNMARWHPDDLAGRLVSELGWDYLCLPALDDNEKPLWPERWTKELLLERKRVLGEYGWASLYQGSPRPRGGTVFGDPHVYTVRPDSVRYAIGLDLAYTARTSADYSVAVVMAKARVSGPDGKARDVYYIVDVIRRQVRAPDFLDTLIALQNRFPTAPMRWYAAGVEKGVGSFFEDDLPRMEVRSATTDKFVRSMPLAAAWNDGAVQVPEQAEWLNDLVTEFVTFTGVDDAHDDCVDAAAAAFDLLAPSDYKVPTLPGARIDGIGALDS